MEKNSTTGYFFIRGDEIDEWFTDEINMKKVTFIELRLLDYLPFAFFKASAYLDILNIFYKCFQQEK